jgi:molybdate transport system ATP-binding protein
MLVNLHGSRGAFTLDAAFDVPMRGITAPFGPSGSGKTTILRCIAGLDRLAGQLTVGDEIWQDSERGIFRPPHQRHVGYVFQEPSLFPHLTVRGNLDFGARRAVAAGTPPMNFDGTVALLGIGPLLDRSTQDLSGGERQRVAVGRALLSAPRVLLMDEPLSALDRATKEDILPYFERLHEQLSVPMLYVSHDLAEVERLADTLVLLDRGRVIAAGPLRDLQTDPQLPLLSGPGASVTLDAQVVRFDEGYALTIVTVDGGELIVAGRHGQPGDARRLRIAAGDVSISRAAPTGSTILNCLPVQIVSIDAPADSPQANLVLALGDTGHGARIVARITRKSRDALALAPGAAVVAQIKGVALTASRGGAHSPSSD